METYEFKQDETLEYNGAGQLSGGYTEGFNTLVASNAKASPKPGGRIGPYRTSTTWARDDHSMTEVPRVIDSRGSLPWDPLRGVVSKRHISRKGARFVFDGSGDADIQSHLENAASAARTKALASVQTLELGANLGEFKQTFSLFTQNAYQLAGALLAAKRGRWGEIPYRLGLRGRDFRTGKTLANRWLEYQYGWRPLMADLHTGYNELYNQSLNPLGLVRLSGSATYSWSKEISSGDVNLPIRQGGIYQVRVVHKATVESPNAFGLSRLGLLNPASVAWELLPFSFVIDWFAPIGNVLEAFTAPIGLNYIDGYESHRTMVNNHWYYVDGNGSLREKMFKFRRYLKSSFGLPEYYANENPFTVGRFANALALSRQLLR